MVRLLLDDGRADLAAHVETVGRAIARGYSDVLRLLFDDGRADPGRYDLVTACEKGHVECVRLLLDDGRVDPVSMNYKALRAAFKRDYGKIVRLLLANRSVDAMVTRGTVDIRKLFYFACIDGSAEVVRVLLAHPRVDQAAVHNEAFIMTCSRSHIEVVRLLLADRRVDPTALGNEGLRSARLAAFRTPPT